MTIEADIQTSETYMLYESYICALKLQGQANGKWYQGWKHMGTGNMGKWNGGHIYGVNLIGT